MSRTRTPSIAFCAANKVGLEIVRFVSRWPGRIAFVATSKRDNPVHEKAIAQVCRDKGIKVYRKIDVNDPVFLGRVREADPSLMVLAWWPQIVREEAIRTVKGGWLNTHPSLLPYGRGKHPYFWSIVDGVPFGVTIHFIDAGIDTGPVLFQKPIPVRFTDTGESLYATSTAEIVALFKKAYPKIRSLKLKPRPQSATGATFHWGKEIDDVGVVDLNKKYKALDLINILRGRTFSKGPSAYCTKDGRKYFLRLSIAEAG